MHVKHLSGVLVAAMIAAAGCAAPAPEASDEEVLERMDALLSEIAGPQTANLDRGTRWRLIASTGTGLPPAGLINCWSRIPRIIAPRYLSASLEVAEPLSPKLIGPAAFLRPRPREIRSWCTHKAGW